MGGPKIEELRDALLVFLKSLPANCKFNIYSFGSNVVSLWPQSMPYNESNMQQALNHVSTFTANFGGTEVLAALRKAVSDRLSIESSSTQVILLTDGEIWQAEKTIDFVRTTTSEADGEVRFFSLGIGNRVSHQLIQGIGFFGGGFGEAVAVDAHGRWKEAVVRMLKGAVMPNSWSYSIQFGDEWDEKRLDLDDFLPDQTARNPPESSLRLAGAADRSFVRAPRTIPLLHHFGQQSVYFLLHSTSDHLPECVTIKACSQHGGTKTTTLAVTKSTTNNIMQHLAAKAAVRDLETQDTVEASSDRIRKNAEHLCQMYSITSKWASFVAVSHLQPSAEYEDVEVHLYKAPLAELDLMTHPGFSQAGANPPALRLASPATTIDYTPPPVGDSMIMSHPYQEGGSDFASTRPRYEDCRIDGRSLMSNPSMMSNPQDLYYGSGYEGKSSPSPLGAWEARYFAPSSARGEAIPGEFGSHAPLQASSQPNSIRSREPDAHLDLVGRRSKESYNETFGRRSKSAEGQAVSLDVPNGKTGRNGICLSDASHAINTLPK